MAKDPKQIDFPQEFRDAYKGDSLNAKAAPSSKTLKIRKKYGSTSGGHGCPNSRNRDGYGHRRRIARAPTRGKNLPRRLATHQTCRTTARYHRRPTRGREPD
ncbi:hypothetical protein BGZ80_011443, partial [Entomortierella chlamydospora]